MLSSNLVRLVLFLALVTVASIASAVAAPAAGRTVGTWLVQHGVVGAWGVAAGLFVGVTYFILLIEGCSRLAYLGAPRRAGPRSSTFLAFFLGGSALLAGWIVVADYLARALTPFVGTPMHPWLEPLLLVLGVIAIGVLGDRLAPRFGISFTRRPKV